MTGTSILHGQSPNKSTHISKNHNYYFDVKYRYIINLHFIGAKMLLTVVIKLNKNQNFVKSDFLCFLRYNTKTSGADLI